MRPSRVAAVVLVAAVAAWLEGCDEATEPQSAPVVRVAAVTATFLTGTVGAEVQPVPSVRVTDERDRPLAGVTITFKVVSGGGTARGGKVTTGEDGSATLANWTLGPTAGTQTLAAGAGGQADVVFTAVAAAGPVAQITPSSGNNQLAGVSQELEQPLVVLAADAFGNPVAGVPVVFTVTAGGGIIEGGAGVTDAAGIAPAAQWRLGAEAGVQRVTAASGAVQGEFRAFAAPPPGELQGKLAFISYADPYLDIAVVNADGSGFTRLTYPGIELQPAWSPDGSRIAFASTNFGVDDELGGTRIGLMTADGANVAWLTEGRTDFSPAWSPDGAAIAFASFGLVAVTPLNPPDAAIMPLIAENGQDGQPAWSPDGHKLAFVSEQRLGSSDISIKDIYIANADGTGHTPLTTGMNALHPAWSPDGSMIAFVHGDASRGDTQFQVAVMAADGVFLKDLAVAGPAPDGEGPGSLAWSPDGRGIAFSFVGCESPEGACRSIKYVSLDGSRQVTLINNAQSPTWTR